MVFNIWVDLLKSKKLEENQLVKDKLCQEEEEIKVDLVETNLNLPTMLPSKPLLSSLVVFHTTPMPTQLDNISHQLVPFNQQELSVINKLKR